VNTRSNAENKDLRNHRWQHLDGHPRNFQSPAAHHKITYNEKCQEEQAADNFQQFRDTLHVESVVVFFPFPENYGGDEQENHQDKNVRSPSRPVIVEVLEENSQSGGHNAEYPSKNACRTSFLFCHSFEFLKSSDIILNLKKKFSTLKLLNSGLDKGSIIIFSLNVKDFF